jgi:hypothetical protein
VDIFRHVRSRLCGNLLKVQLLTSAYHVLFHAGRTETFAQVGAKSLHLTGVGKKNAGKIKQWKQQVRTTLKISVWCCVRARHFELRSSEKWRASTQYSFYTYNVTSKAGLLKGSVIIHRQIRWNPLDDRVISRGRERLTEKISNSIYFF